MSDYFDSMTRWDATHTKSITIGYQESNEDEILREDVKGFGLSIHSLNKRIAETFGVAVETDSIIDRAVLEAIANGDHVFYMEYGKHSSEWLSLLDKFPTWRWDSGCVGVLIVHREAWLKALPRSTFTKTYVSRILNETIGERVTAVLNGWLYQAEMDDGECVCIRDGYLTAEEAFWDVIQEFPEIRYKEDDFDKVTTFTLKTA